MINVGTQINTKTGTWEVANIFVQKDLLSGEWETKATLKHRDHPCQVLPISSVIKLVENV